MAFDISVYWYAPNHANAFYDVDTRNWTIVQDVYIFYVWINR